LKDGRSTRTHEGTNLDKREVLLPGGTLWRVNPISARGMKQGLRIV
jgi:hypothetical protein